MRAKTQMLNKPEDGTLGKIWNYRCQGHSLDECFHPDFFIPLKDHFLAGDQVHLIEINDKGHIARYCETMVIYNIRDNNQLLIRPINGGVQDLRQVQKPKEPKPEPEPPREQFVKGNGEVKYNKKTKSFDVIVGEETACSMDDADMAASIARGDVPIPS